MKILKNFIQLQRLCIYFMLFGVLALSCSDDSSDSGRDLDTRYIEAMQLSDTWCIQTQVDLAGLDGSDTIEMTVFDTYTGLMTKYPIIDTLKDRPIQVVSYTSTMVNNTDMSAQKILPRESMCKFVNIENISYNLPAVNTDPTEGTCRQMNEKALQWALDQLTVEELARYNNEGKHLYFDDDIMALGSSWYSTCSEFDATADPYTYSSAAQFLEFSETAPKTGNHYCKLISPSQMLFWVLNRAFWDDPLGTGPNYDEDSSLVCHIEGPASDCMLDSADIKGSCIYYFPLPQINLCIDYSGENYSGTGAEVNCTGRNTTELPSRFSELSCAERSDLNDGTNFEDLKGTCVLQCGDPDKEYRMNIYNYTYYENGDLIPPDVVCPAPTNMWYPAFE